MDITGQGNHLGQSGATALARHLCLADRNFFGYELWQLAQGTGADLLWRMKKNMRMACEKRFPTALSERVYPSERDCGTKPTASCCG